MIAKASRTRWSLILLVVLVLALVVPSANAETQRLLIGKFGIDSSGYDSLPLVVGLIDASPYFGDAPVTLPSKEAQYLGTVTGVASDGAYQVTLPDQAAAAALDVTNGKTLSSGGLSIFDIRLMSDVVKRGVMVPNEDNIASTLRITIDYRVAGGNLFVLARDANQQFPTGPGTDGILFTTDDPRIAIPAGWSVVNLDQTPYAISQDLRASIDLITTEIGGANDYTGLSCEVLVPTLLDRLERTYPFTALYKIDWAALKAALNPRAQNAKDRQSCEMIIRDLGNAIPDGHVNYVLPSLRAEYAGSLGMQMTPLTDGGFAVSLLTATGPARKAGIQLGAIIESFDGKPVEEALNGVILQGGNASTPHALLARRLDMLNRGPMNSAVEITFRNPGEKSQIVTLRRAQPQRADPTVRSPRTQGDKLESGIGYLRLDSFTSLNDMIRFDWALNGLIQDNVPGIIIDIRSNPGGFSQISDALASRFFEQPFLIGKQLTNDGRYVYQMQVEPRAPIYTGPVAILVNLNTSSAGDLFAYTFKVSGRGLIIGNTPSGGLAGTVSGGQYMLPGSAFIQVPTGALIDDKGQIIVEGQGVAPDVLVPITVQSIVSQTDTILQAAEESLKEAVR